MCNLKVSELINQRSEWDIPKINSLVHVECMTDITSTPLPIARNSLDKPSWGASGNGKFSIENCYMQVLKRNEANMAENIVWNWIWKLKLPNKIFISFGWLDKIES